MRNDDFYQKELSISDFEYFIERAGILEFDGNQTREEANMQAFHEITIINIDKAIKIATDIQHQKNKKNATTGLFDAKNI